MDHSLFRNSWVLFCGVSLLACLSWATSFNERPFEEGVEDAPLIVRGKVGMSYANWATSTDGAKRIYTYTELQVDEVLKGYLSGQSVMVRELGGEKDGVGMQVPGSARFSRGEDVVLFLGESNSDDSHDVRGMMMGKYMIQRDESGKEYLAGAGMQSQHRHPIGGPSHGVDMMDHPESQNDTPSNVRWTLDAVRSLIKDQAQKKALSQQAQNNPSELSGVSPVPNADRSKTPPQLSVLSSPAPRLQSNENEASGFGWTTFLGLTVGVLAAGVLLAGLRKKR